RGSTFISLPLVGAAVLVWRALYGRVVRSSFFNVNVAIIGVGDAARRTAHLLLESPNSPYRLRAFISPMGEEASSALGVPVVSARGDLWAVVRELDLDQVIVGPTQSLPSSMLNDLVKCFDHGVEALPATAVYESVSGRV